VASSFEAILSKLFVMETIPPVKVPLVAVNLRDMVLAVAVSTSQSFPPITLNVVTFQSPHSRAETGFENFCSLLLIKIIIYAPAGTTFYPVGKNERLIIKFVSNEHVALGYVLAPTCTGHVKLNVVPPVLCMFVGIYICIFDVECRGVATVKLMV
jgi:hypothetical protein